MGDSQNENGNVKHLGRIDRIGTLVIIAANAVGRRSGIVTEVLLLNAVANAIGYARHYSRSHDVAIRVYDDACNVIETHEHKGDFKER